MDPAPGALAPIPVKGFDPELSRKGCDLVLVLADQVKRTFPKDEQPQVFAGIAGTLIGNVTAYELRKSPAHAEAFLVSIMILVDSTLGAFGYDSMTTLQKMVESWKASQGQAVRS